MLIVGIDLKYYRLVYESLTTPTALSNIKKALKIMISNQFITVIIIINSYVHTFSE